MFTKTFQQLSKKDVAEAGGKGASLGEMTQAGINVPPGFVVLSTAFNRFLEETNLINEIEALFHKVNPEDINSVDRTSNEIHALIGKTLMPPDIKKSIDDSFVQLKAKYVAVRSSATAEDSTTASWAGELETYLNVTKTGLTDAVKKCWSSLFTPRAIFYRYEKKLNKQSVSVAVVVQKMIQSEVSGVCFTVHPVTQDWGQMVIEAGYGLGEAIVSGMITPDTYIVHKGATTIPIPKNASRTKELVIFDKSVSEQKIMIARSSKGTKKINIPKANQSKQKLSDVFILKLARICKSIEEHYNIPQDIEWALENGKLHIMQSRPITTLI